MTVQAGFRLSRAQMWVAILGSILGSVVLFYWAARTTGQWSAVLSGVASALLGLGAVTLISDIYIKPAFTHDVYNIVQLEHRLHAVGIQEVAPDEEFDWQVVYEGSSEVRALVLRPSLWLDRDWNFVAANARRKCDVTVVFADPTGAHISSIARQAGQDVESYKQAVESTAKRLEQSWKQAKAVIGGSQIHPQSSLSILYLQEHPAYSLVTADTQSVLVMPPVIQSSGASGRICAHFKPTGSQFPAPWISQRWDDVMSDCAGGPVFTDKPAPKLNQGKDGS